MKNKIRWNVAIKFYQLKQIDFAVPGRSTHTPNIRIDHCTYFLPIGREELLTDRIYGEHVDFNLSFVVVEVERLYLNLLCTCRKITKSAMDIFRWFWRCWKTVMQLIFLKKIFYKTNTKLFRKRQHRILVIRFYESSISSPEKNKKFLNRKVQVRPEFIMIKVLFSLSGTI